MATQHMHHDATLHALRVGVRSVVLVCRAWSWHVNWKNFPGKHAGSRCEHVEAEVNLNN